MPDGPVFVARDAIRSVYPDPTVTHDELAEWVVDALFDAGWLCDGTRGAATRAVTRAFTVNDPTRSAKPHELAIMTVMCMGRSMYLRDRPAVWEA